MQRDYLKEAIKIAEGKTLLLPEVEHLKAMLNELRRFEKYEADDDDIYEELKEFMTK